jgi:chemosensory pili system protein ChpA (sensor histidine kinase/response regulator)
MATSSKAPAESHLDIGVNDLGPLAWVLDELRKSLDSAAKALKRYVRDAELAKGSDLNAADASQLRIARQQLHQSVGALEMVGFNAPAAMVRGMEGAVQKFVTKPELCTEAAAAKVERASFSLLGYLDALLVGKKPSAVELFAPYAEVQELAGATRIHPADLWAVPWRWLSVQDMGGTTAELDADFRARFDKAALMVVKTADRGACTTLADLSAGLANQKNLAVDDHFRSFWRLAAGFFEAVATGSLVADLHVKRTASRLLIQLATHVKGDLNAPDRLAQDLVFFCAQSMPESTAPRLGEVRLVYGLANYLPVDYTKSSFGQFDPTLVVQARKRISQLKESWSSFTAGELSKAKPVQDQMALLVDSIQKLLPTTGQNLITAINEVVDSTARVQRPPEPSLGMEVATSILYLEASFEDFDPADTQLAHRMAHLAQRVQMARGGAASQPLESWMEELYRKVSDRQTMGSVVGELKLTLGELEKLMDAYFRDPQDKVLLTDVPSKLTQMRGVLTVLGLEQAGQAVMRMRESVEQIIVTEIDVDQVKHAGTFDKLGNNLGALGFLIDMLSYQPVLAKKLFVYDDKEGELRPLMGRTLAPEEPVVSAAEGSQAVAGATSAQTESAGAQAPAPAVITSAAPSAPVIVDADEVDPELLEIFLEEAREVAGNGLAATQALVVEPNNLGEMTTLRRAFHTLKGSSRMVGLNVFGEAAWSMEQVLNAWLADQKPASTDLCNLSTQALKAQQVWIEEIAGGGGKQRTSMPFRSSADALRLHGQFIPITLEAAAPAVAAEPVAVVAELVDVAPPASLAVAAVAAIAVLPQVVIEPPAPIAASLLPDEPAAELLSFDFDTLELPSLAAAPVALPEIFAPEISTPPAVSMEDFSLHLGDLDGQPAAPALLAPEPVITIATPVVAAVANILPDSEPAPLANSQAEALFDFDFPPSPPEQASQASQASQVSQATQASSESAPVVTADAGSTVDVFEIPLDEPTIEPASTLSTEAFDLPPESLSQSISALIDTPELQTETLTVQEQSDLITAEELAAFEQAMMAMDADSGLADTTSPPASVDSSILAMNVSQADSAGLDAGDLSALESLAISMPSAPTELVNTAPMTMIAPAMTHVQTLPEYLGHDLGQDFDSRSTVPAELAMFRAPEPQSLGIDLSSNASETSKTESSASMWGAGAAAIAGLGASATVAAFSSRAAPSAAVSAPVPMSNSFNADEQIKAIGPLRVSLPLYNVYLNEADEWSRRLSTVLAEWAMEPHAKVPNDAVAFSHSLAGSSATVGFSALSGLSRNLEHALMHMQRIEEDGEYDPHAHASLFVNAAEEVRHLLHQFAAGILKDSSAQIEADLQHSLQAPFVVSQVADLNVVTADSSSGFINLDDDLPAMPIEVTPSAIDHVASSVAAADPAPPVAVQSWATPEIVSPVPQASAVPLDAEIAAPEPEVAATVVQQEAVIVPVVAPVAVSSFVAAAAVLTVAPVLAVRSRQVGQDEIDDEIDVQDALDPDLFEIFEEEALELFPTTASALRQWTARPDNMSARGEVLRGLHTLKGSARLAGAMRLGEMAHRMESSVESIPQEGGQSADIEQLMAQLDGMQHNFDVLRNPALATQNIAPLNTLTSTSADSTVSVSTAATGSAVLGMTATSMAQAVSALKPVAAATGTVVAPAAAMRSAPGQTVRVRAQLLDRLMNQAGEVMITRARLETELSQLRGSLSDLTGNLEKMRSQLRELDVQAESQMQTRIQQAKETEEAFDPLEFDRYTRVQELTRMMAESVNDVATVHRNIQRSIESTEDDLVAQARQTRDLQRDLLRTRMVEFEGISERLYRVVRQAGKDAGKQVKLDILGGTIEMDRGVLDRMTPAFEHLLRNCVAHGIEAADARTAAGKAASGEIIITLHQEGNDVSIEFRDDGAGLNIARIREKAIAQGLLGSDAALADNDAANLIFTPGFSTAAQVTELSGRGVGMDVVRSEVVALGGRIETATTAGQGTSFKLVLPLTTAVTQVVMVRVGALAIGIPANLIEIVRRATQKELQQAYNAGSYEYGGESLPFFWAGALLQHSAASNEPATKTLPVMVFRSAAQRVALHIDEVLGNQEVVVKNLGPQLSRLPGLAGMTVLASGAVALIYNPVALATVYGMQARAMSFDPAQPHALEQSAGSSQMGALDPSITDAVPRELSGDAAPVVPFVPANPASISPPAIPLVLIVDDSITVRRVTQRLLQREGYRVTMAADGLQALERLAEELPSVILSDIEMPRMDGFDFLRNVRGSAEYKHLPTIMITSRIAEKHREHAFELGANHYLGKPYNEEELLSLIRRYAREEATI